MDNKDKEHLKSKNHTIPGERRKQRCVFFAENTATSITEIIVVKVKVSYSTGVLVRCLSHSP